MLTIKAPIELKCSTSMVPSQESFYHRITGNYELLSSGIDREDLLHVVTAPPEIYLGEGGMTSIVNNTRVQNSQETKMEVINNLLNRIAFTEEVNLTYQDRVYITDVLNRMGIRNVQQFMNQVSRLKQETQTTEQLISLYWNHLDQLTEMVEEYHHQEQQRQSVTEVNQTAVSRNLHEEILNRLQTGAIYQILNNFYTSHNGSSRYVSSQELQVTEQKRVAVNVLLNQLKQSVNGEEVPFVYRHENYYETASLEENQVTTEAVNTQITSAVLLNLVDNLYLNRFEKQNSGFQTWLHMEDALYQTAENTLWRLKYEMTDQSRRYERREEQSISQQQIYEQEINSIWQLLTLAEEGQTEGTAIYETISGNQIPEPAVYERADMEHPLLAEETEEGEPTGTAGGEKGERERQIETKRQVERYLETVKETSEGRKPGEEAASQPPSEPVIHVQQQEQVFKDAARRQEEGRPEKREPDRTVPLHLTYQNVTEQEESVHQETEETHISQTEIRQNRFQEQIQQYMRFLRPVEERQIYLHTENHIQQTPEAGKEERMNLTFPETEPVGEPAVSREILERWQSREPGQEEKGGYERGSLRESQTVYRTERENQILTEIYEDRLERIQTENGQTRQVYEDNRSQEENLTVFKQQDQQVFVNPEENLELLEQQLKQINEQNIENFNRYQQMVNIRNTEQKTVLEHPAERIRRESLKALENPGQLLEEYRQKAQEQEHRKDRRVMELTKLLPEETRRIYEQLEEYQKQPEAYRKAGHISENNIGLLLHDIKEVERENRTESRISEEETKRIQEMSETVLEKWNDRPAPEAVSRRETQLTRNDISLIHKSLENRMDEEVLEQLMEQNRLLNQKTRITDQVQEEKQTVNTTVYQQNHQMLVKESQDITELIQRGVQRQVGAISEQVYSRLEKRLQNEKKRRGY